MRFSDYKIQTPNIIGDKRLSSKADIANAKKNSQTIWGKHIVEKILEVADYWANKPDESLIELIPTGNPRALTPGQFYGDPLTGGNRTTLYTSFETPYKWYNPKTDVWWYNGQTIKNPTTKEDLVVFDNGNGFIAPTGFPKPAQKYMFTAAYRLFTIGALCGFFYAPVLTKDMYKESTETRYGGAIPNLAQAFVLTGKRIYLRKVAILIGRLAEFYPHQNGTRGDGTKGRGMHWGEISTTESMWLTEFFKACDLIWNAIDTDLILEITNLFSSATDFYHNKRSDSFDFRRAVENMAREAIRTCEVGRATDSDWSLRWIETELYIAKFIDDSYHLKKVLYGGKFNLQRSFFNNFYRDGRYHYDSTSYMRFILRQFIAIATVGWNILGDGDRDFYTSTSLSDFMKERILSIVSLNFKIGTGPMLPSFGDTHEAENKPGSILKRKRHLMDYDPRMEIIAKTWPELRPLSVKYLQGYKPDDLISIRKEKGDFLTLCFALPNNKLIEAPEVLSTPTKKIKLTQTYGSTLLQDSSIAYIRSGKTPETQHSLVLWGQPSAAHEHGDKLGIWFGGRGCHLAASGGNYPFTWVSPKARGWEKNSAACFTVIIDGKTQKRSVSRVIDYYAGDMFQICAMDCDIAYRRSDYRRSVMLVQAPIEGDVFVLDIFQASHGKILDYNTRGTDAGKFSDIQFNCEDKITWKPMTGTLAGESKPLYGSRGYGWLKAEKRTKTGKNCQFTYRYGNAGLKFHLLPYEKTRKIICCYGEKGGYEMGKSPWDPHIIWRDTAERARNHKTQFVSILESIGENPFIKRIEQLKTDQKFQDYFPIGLKIIYETGDYDVAIAATVESHTHLEFIDKAGKKWRTDANRCVCRYNPENILLNVEAYRGSYLITPEKTFRFLSELSGQIRKVDYDTRIIQVDLDIYSPVIPINSDTIDGLIGFIYNKESKNTSTYYIRTPELTKDRLVFTVDLSLIHSLRKYRTVKAPWIKKRPNKKIKGLKVKVDFQEGDKFILPLYFRFAPNTE